MKGPRKIAKQVLEVMQSLESDDSTFTDSEDSDSDFANLLAFYTFSGTEDHPRHRGYLNVIAEFNDLEFWRHFRVSRSSCRLITDFLRSKGCEASPFYHGGPRPVSVDEMAYIALEYLGNQGSIRLWSMKYNRAESTIWTAVSMV